MSCPFAAVGEAGDPALVVAEEDAARPRLAKCEENVGNFR
jgi:hypothetical protein